MRGSQSVGSAWSRRVARVACLGSAVVLASLLSACGGGGDGGPTGGGSRSVVGFAEWQLAPLGLTGLDVSIGGTGSSARLDAVVDWTFASNDIAVFLTGSSCTEAAFVAAQCLLLGSADGAKPERVTYNLASGGSFRFWIANFGPGQESGTIEVGLTQ